MSRSHSVEDAVFEEVHAITYEVWTLPVGGKPPQPAITGIPTVAEAFDLQSKYGGAELFQVRDSLGGIHQFVRDEDGPANTADEAPAVQPKERFAKLRSFWNRPGIRWARSLYNGSVHVVGTVMIWGGFILYASDYSRQLTLMGTGAAIAFAMMHLASAANRGGAK